jgi:hypothetical protein
MAQSFDSFGEWMAWAFSPEHVVISVLAAAIGLGTLLALGLVIERAWRRANERVDGASEPATALRTDWWLCPVCNSLNRPSQHCYKGCATIDGEVLPSRSETSRDI